MKFITSTLRAAALCGFAFLAATTAYGQSEKPFQERFAKLIEAARAEGQLTWYQSSLAKAGSDYAALFEKKFGIKVNQIYIVGSPNLERFRAESRAGHHIADVFTTSDGTLMLPALNEGLLADYKTASLGAFRKSWLMQVKGAIAYPTSRVQMAVAYNTKAAKPQEVAMLKEWKGLTEPFLRDGRFSIADATRIGAVYPTYLYFLRANAKQFGRPYLEKMAAQKPIIYGGMTDQVGRMAAGEVDFGLLVDLVAIMQYKLGAPIAWVYPTPTPVALHYTGLSRNAPHPNAARLFVEYITSTEGMSEWGRVFGAGTGRPDVDAKSDAPFTKEPWYKAPTDFFEIQDWVAAEREHEGVIKEWSSIFRK